MNPLELTVTEEQVKKFLDEEIVDFYDDIIGPKNYFRYIANASDDAGFPIKFPDVTGDFRDYLKAIIDVRGKIDYTLATLGSPGLSKDKAMGKDKNELIDEHYQALVKLVETYNKGVEILSQDPKRRIKSEVTKMNELLARQIFIVNMLFDPEKSKGEFMEKITSDTSEFPKYVDMNVKI